MKAPSFQSRVKSALKTGDLTVADLRAWFGRPYPTVWRWVNSGWVPRGPDGKQAVRDLDALERAIRKRRFPMPGYVTTRRRSGYVKDIYNAAERARLFKARTAC